MDSEFGRNAPIPAIPLGLMARRKPDIRQAVVLRRL
jgi:hypothetical protein